MLKVTWVGVAVALRRAQGDEHELWGWERTNGCQAELVEAPT